MSLIEYISKSAQPISMPFTFLIIVYLAASMYIGQGVFCVLHVYFVGS
jgi:hypothetical protein